MTNPQTEARAIAEQLMLPDEDVFNLAVDIIAAALSAELETVKGVSKTAITHANERYGELDASFRRVVAENADLLGKLAAAEAKLASGEATHRHKKRGTEYVLIGIGKMQCDWWEHAGINRYPVDMREVAIYRSVDDGSLWVRPREEFEDGRFEALTHPAPTHNDGGVEKVMGLVDAYADALVILHIENMPPAAISTAQSDENKKAVSDARAALEAALRGDAS